MSAAANGRGRLLHAASAKVQRRTQVAAAKLDPSIALKRDRHTCASLCEEKELLASRGILEGSEGYRLQEAISEGEVCAWASLPDEKRTTKVG
jgi:hypothetical protein